MVGLLIGGLATVRFDTPLMKKSKQVSGWGFDVTEKEIRDRAPSGATHYFITSASNEIEYLNDHYDVWFEPHKKFRPLPRYFIKRLTAENRIKPLN